MNGIALVALGNRLRQDDGVGPLILDRLAQLNIPDNTSLIWLEHNPCGLCFLDPALEAVMIVDALSMDTMRPGTILTLPLYELACQWSLNLHQLSPLELLHPTLHERTQILGIIPERLGYGFGLSPLVARAVNRAVRYLHAWVWEAHEKGPVKNGDRDAEAIR